MYTCAYVPVYICMYVYIHVCMMVIKSLYHIRIERGKESNQHCIAILYQVIALSLDILV